VLAVAGDSERLAQVVGNLLANAAMHANPGGRLTVSGATVQGSVGLKVQDTGIGIALDILPHIFDLFVQEAQALDRSRGGRGLGREGFGTVGGVRGQVAQRWRDRALTGARDGEVAPRRGLDQHRRIDRRGQMRRQRLGAAAARGDARQRLRIAEERFGSIPAQRPGLDYVLVMHR